MTFVHDPRVRELLARAGLPEDHDWFEQLDDGSWKLLSACDGDDMASIDAWHKRRYARALATRRKVRDGRTDLLRCDVLVRGGEFCGRSPCVVQVSGPIGEPRALCDRHESLALTPSDDPGL
jgi:hypothetical protein